MVVAAGALGAFVLWPRPAKEALSLGKRLEASGDAAGAVAAYGRVCELAPADEELCGFAKPHAAALELRIAEGKLEKLAFTDARTDLDRLSPSAVKHVASEAAALAKSKDLTSGIRWEESLKLTD
ncbi:MAG: hypothetical protein IT374_28160 [Polyangiaceae bacterium]|nr:hypothetical protein [Polyangiaceae bacterium]